MNTFSVVIRRLLISQPSPIQATVRCLQTSCPVTIHASSSLCGNPLKKKKQTLDPQKAKKKIRKIEKAIRKLESKGRKLKPIIEIEGDRAVRRTRDNRLRETEALSFDEVESRALLLKEWTRYKWKQLMEEETAIKRAQNAQAEALREVKVISQELFEAAVQLDDSLIPFEKKGPTHTPAVKNYPLIDGEYTDTTEKYDK